MSGDEAKYQPGATAELLNVGAGPKATESEKKTVWRILLLAGITTVLPWNFYMSAYDFYLAKFSYDPDAEIICSSSGAMSTPCEQQLEALRAYCIYDCTNDTSPRWGKDGYKIVDIPNPTSSKPIEKYHAEAYKFVLDDGYGQGVAAKSAKSNFYVNFWNSSLSFLTMGTMLVTSLVVASSWVQLKLSEQTRITKGLMFVMICLAITIVLSYIDLAVGNFFAITLIVVVAINLASGFYQCTVFQFCACFPGELYNAMLQGQAVGGIFANTMAIFCTIVFPYIYDQCKEKIPMYNGMATAFFLIGLAVAGGTLVMYKKMIAMDTYKYYAGDDGKVGTADDGIALVDESGDALPKTTSTKEIFTGAKFHLFAVYMTFTVTLALFPTLVAQVMTSGNIFMTANKDGCGKNGFNPLFFKVTVLLGFNVGDYIGRKFTSYKLGLTAKNSGPRVALYSIARALFYFIFMACNVTGFRENVLFANDYTFVVAMLAFGITNGWVGGLAMEFAPTQFESPNDKLQVGSYTITVLTLGLMSGAALSFVIADKTLVIQTAATSKAVLSKLPEIVYKCTQKCVTG